MRILMAHNYYQFPGGEDVVFSAEQELLASNDHIILVYKDNNTRLVSINKAIATLQGFWSFTSKRKISTILRQNPVDIAHFHNTFLLISPAAYWTCRDHRVPVIQTLHNFRLMCPAATFFRQGNVCEDCLGRFLAWSGIRHACYRESRAETALTAAVTAFHQLIKTWRKAVDVYIALTEFSRRKFIDSGIPEHKILVKPNFVFPDPGPGNSGKTFVLFVGAFRAHKGIRTLLKAWKFLPDIPLKMVGDGPLLCETRDFMKKYNLTNIELLGRQSHEDVLKLMKQSLFLVFPSECYEGFPLTVVEAMACGLPTIASSFGTMQEIIEDGRTGLLFEPGSPEKLAAAVEWAWQNERAVAEMGEEARCEYESKYTAQKNYETLMEIYQHAKANAQ